MGHHALAGSESGPPHDGEGLSGAASIDVAGVFSTRFLIFDGQGTFTYAVPQGKRAVVKQISIVNLSGGNAGYNVAIGTTRIWYGSVPGGTSAVSGNLTLVANAGELLSISTGVPQMSGVVCGFLLDMG